MIYLIKNLRFLFTLNIQSKYNPITIHTQYMNIATKICLQKLFTQAKTAQAQHFHHLQQQCDFVSEIIDSLEISVEKMSSKLENISTILQDRQLMALRKQQNQFIIKELQTKLDRTIAREEQTNQKLINAHHKITHLEYQLQEQQHREIVQLKQQLEKRNQQVNKLMREVQKRQQNTPTKEDLKDEQFNVLAERLNQIEGCMSWQVSNIKEENKTLRLKVKQLQNSLLEKQLQYSKQIYESEVKIKYYTSLNRQLEEGSQLILKKAGQTQLMLHQKLKQMKNSVIKDKKELKEYRHEVKQAIRKLVFSLDFQQSKIIMIMEKKGIEDKLSQIKKEIIKEKKKSIGKIIGEKDALIQRLQYEINLKTKKINELSVNLEKKKYQKNQKNNTSASNKSLDISDERVKTTIEKLKSQIKYLQNSADDFKKKYEEDENRYNEQLLEKEQQIINLRNKMRLQQKQYLEQKHQWEKKLLHQKKSEQKISEELKENITSSDEKINQISRKLRAADQRLQNKEKLINQLEKVAYERDEQARKAETKMKNKISEIERVLNAKQKIIEDLIHKHQAKVVELKLVSQKLKILEIGEVHKKEENEKQIKRMIQVQAKKKQLEQKLGERQKELFQKNQQLKEIVDSQNQVISVIKMIRQTLSHLPYQSEQNQTFMKEIKNKLDSIQEYILKTQIKTSKEIQEEQHKHMIKELNSKLHQKQEIIKAQNLKIFQEREQFHQLFRQKQIELQSIQNKVKSIENNSASDNLLQPKVIESRKTKPSFMKGTESFQMVEKGTMTDQVVSDSSSVNFFNGNFEPKNVGQKKYGNILEGVMVENISQESGNISEPKIQKRESSPLKNSNLFKHLRNSNQNEDNFFEICDDEEEVNFGKSAANLELRQVFTQIRIQLEKFMNDEEISINALKMLPQAIQQDFLEFTAYMKEKFKDIRSNNQISFIMASAGREASVSEEDLSLQLPQLLNNRRHSQDLARIIEEKDVMISNLMSQKTSQQNTINQLTLEKEQIEEQNQNRFMNQCNVYKREIKQLKKSKDVLEMNSVSLKNIMKNLLEAICEEDDMEDDVRDNLILFAKVGHLNQKQKARLNYYILQYRKMKSLE